MGGGPRPDFLGRVLNLDAKVIEVVACVIEGVVEVGVIEAQIGYHVVSHRIGPVRFVESYRLHEIARALDESRDFVYGRAWRLLPV